MTGNADDTVLLKPRRRRRAWPWMAAAALLLSAGLGAGGVWFLRPPPPPPAVPGEAIGSGSEDQIDADVPPTLTIFRFAPNPAVLVLDFPTLAEQGRMLNRVAALVEKAGEPHDRLLSDQELDAAIRGGGDTPETYYYGHDYSIAEINRFFALADRDHVVLNPDEQRLRRLVAQASAEPLGMGALISLPRADAANRVDQSSRVAILHHELSHGEYFTNPIFSRFVANFWSGVLTEAERALFRTYLGSEGYDTGVEDLMINESQAYLMYTPDPRFFDPAKLGIPPARLAEIRQAFAAGMPSCWLRAETPGVVEAAR